MDAVSYTHLDVYKRQESTLGQGITTEFAGHCGLGVAPVQDDWLYMFPEKRAFTKVMPEPPGGINPYNAYLVPTRRLREPFAQAYGQELDVYKRQGRLYLPAADLRHPTDDSLDVLRIIGVGPAIQTGLGKPGQRIDNAGGGFYMQLCPGHHSVVRPEPGAEAVVNGVGQRLKVKRHHLVPSRCV